MDPFVRFKEASRRPLEAGFAAAKGYSVVPTVAFAQPVQVYALAASYNTRFVFTGGEDGLVKKYDFHASLNGLGVQMSQRQMQIDTITKSGVLCAYWENEQPLAPHEYQVDPDGTYVPQVSPVYSLQAQCQALWVCAGMRSGDICFQAATYGDVGRCVAVLAHHRKPVADLHLNSAESMLLSGSWDKSVALWDLNRADPVRVYGSLSGQISAVRWQPAEGPAVSADQDEMDSLFGSDDDSNNNELEDEIDNALSTEMLTDPDATERPEQDAAAPRSRRGSTQATAADADARPAASAEDSGAGQGSASPKPEPAGAPARSALPTGPATQGAAAPPPTARQDVFLACTINGVVHVLDQRQPLPVAAIANSQAPPWAMSACWSVDGSQVYIGRRNAQVDAFDVRKMDAPSRVLRFPSNSGAVSCVEVLPNNRGLLCASSDNIRLYELDSAKKTPFIIVPGHHGSVVSRVLVDPSGTSFVSACGGRGWVDAPVDYVLGYEITSEI